jgi:uncharacterized membrane protein
VVRARTDLGLVAVLTVVGGVAAALLPDGLVVLRALLALPLVLALPGYAVLAAIFEPGELRASELVLLSITISIAATIFAALLLQAFGIGLTSAPWVGLLAAVSLATVVIGDRRGHARALMLPHVSLRAAEILALAGAVALLSVAAALGFTPLGPPKSTAGTSTLWILPAPHGRSAVCVGVINQELHASTYSVQLVVAGVPARRFGPIRLASGGTWTRVVAVGSARPVVTATLSKVGSPSTAYRSAALRVWNVATRSC